MEWLSQALSILLLVLGFGFVIFWHELGHFLAAKYVGIRVEQFAVGFGQAIFAWRKGVGVRVGTTVPHVDERVAAERSRREANAERGPDGEVKRVTVTDEQIQDELGIGETEYRLNWIPLGGYVKMLGQDDLKPGVTVDDPRAYNRKSIGARMLVVSAGVIMNIILAAFGFMAVFLMGFNAPPPVVGNVEPMSPAQLAGLQVGDRILHIDGTTQHDFTKISLSAALADPYAPMPLRVRRPDGTEQNLQISARRADSDPAGFLGFGIGFPAEMRGIKKNVFDDLTNLTPDQSTLKPDEIITHINGQPVEIDEMHKLDRALQASGGKPIEITIKNVETNQSRSGQVIPHFLQPFGSTPLNFGGLAPRVAVDMVDEKSPAKDKLQIGDAIAAVIIDSTKDRVTAPATSELQRILDEVGQKDQTVTLEVVRNGQPVTVANLTPTVKLPGGRRGLLIGLSVDEEHAVLSQVPKDTLAFDAGLRGGETITAINGQPVANWFDIHRLMKASDDPKELANKTMQITVAERAEPIQLKLTQEAAEQIALARYWHRMLLHEHQEPRKTNNPLVAAAWGVTETRDFVLQFYLTLQRMVQGSVSHKNLMGPVGIVYAGSRFAFKGTDWLIWFLAMISANLAVVNFLPIPIVDGGLFLFLIVEKIQGRPLSPKTQSIAQIVGLAVILGVFLLVTYQDIARFFP